MFRFARRILYFSIGYLVTRSSVRSLAFSLLKKALFSRKNQLPSSTGSGEEAAMRRYLLYFLLPLWLVPGLLDYRMHRKTDIEHTAGLPESIIHSLMMTEIGIPVLLGLVLEINAGFLLLSVAAFFLHEATAFWDVAYATKRRDVQPNEQHIHSFLEVLPFCALSFVVCLHWEQFSALFGMGPEKPDFNLRLKKEKVPTPYIAGITAAIFIFIALPYGEELLRCAFKPEQLQELSA